MTLAFMPVRDDFIHFVQHQLIEFQPRDNYRELLQLLLLFLGAKSSGNVNFQAPGACHRAC